MASKPESGPNGGAKKADGDARKSVPLITEDKDDDGQESASPPHAHRQTEESTSKQLLAVPDRRSRHDSSEFSDLTSEADSGEESTDHESDASSGASSLAAVKLKAGGKGKPHSQEGWRFIHVVIGVIISYAILKAYNFFRRCGLARVQM